MQRWRTLTVGDVMDGLARYRPFVLTLAGILFLAVILPGARRSGDAASGVDNTAAAGVGTQAGTATETAEDLTGARVEGVDTGGATGTVGRVGSTGQRAGSTANLPTGARSGGQLAAGAQALGDPLQAPDCNKSVGRIFTPSVYSPNCVGLFAKGGDNGGATYPGVTKDTIKVALYEAEPNAAVNAIVTAGGFSDATEDDEDDVNRDKVIEAFEAHYETYGRHVIWEKVVASGPQDDDAAAKADAIKVATEVKAFASFGAPTGTNVYNEELAARGVLCFECAISQPAENYAKWGSSWGILMASTQGYVHRGDYAGRLAGKKAKWAGDPLYQQKDRTFGLVFYNTPDNAYLAGANFFEKYIKDKYGIRLTARIEVTGAHIDPAAAQEESRVVAAKLKDLGVTTVLPATDPLYPIFLTQESTRQAYNPEWMITGAVLQDTGFFGRLYDQTQWQHAFGVSYLTARIDGSVTDNELNLTEWHFGEALTSTPNSLQLGLLYIGVHLAGPKLNIDTFRQGMFSFRPVAGHITHIAGSFGTGLWPWPDYVIADDAAEIWWDYDEPGQTETGTDGTGMYRYMNMGKRYLPGTWPKAEPVPFDTANTVLIYDKRPAGDEIPQPPHKHVRVTPAQHKA